MEDPHEHHEQQEALPRRVRAAGLVFAGVFGAAASLGVDGGNAQAGQDANLSCDANGVKVEGYAIEQGTGVEPTSHGVTVSGIDDNCMNLFLSARTLDSDDKVLGNGVVKITGEKVTATYNADYGATSVPVSKIEKVSLVIT